MADASEEKTDGSSIRPVSSLRNHFENMFGSNPAAQSSTSHAPRQPSPFIDRLGKQEELDPVMGGRVSLDAPRRSGASDVRSQATDMKAAHISTIETPQVPIRSTVKKSRPTSMGPLSPRRSPPVVTVDSPKSPPKVHPEPRSNVVGSIRGAHLNSSEATSPHAGPRSRSPTPLRHFKVPSRPTSPSTHPHPTVLLQSSIFPGQNFDPIKPGSAKVSSISKSPVPPPINRAGKPTVPGNKFVAPEPSEKKLQVPDTRIDTSNDRISPFSTPPSSDDSPHDSPPFVDPSPKSRDILAGPKYTASSTDGYFTQTPVRPSEISKRNAARVRSPGKVPPPPKARHEASGKAQQASDLPENRPGLPPRREIVPNESRMRPPPPDPPPARRSIDTSTRPPAAEPGLKSIPASRALQSGANALSLPVSTRQGTPLSSSKAPAEAAKSQTSLPYDSDDAENAVDKLGAQLNDYPNSSEANRRPPVFKEGISEIPTKYDSKLFGVCGDFICTTGYVTRVWDVLSGELLVSSSHGDTVKVTAMSFRPAPDVEDEGKRIWLGTNIGEIHEIDVPSNNVVCTKANAHAKREIIKMYRCAGEMWTLDDDGKLHIWPSDETGSPSLNQMPHSFRVPRGHTFSMVVGSSLWHAAGKDIRIFQRDASKHTFTPILQHCLHQPGAGEVTSGAIIPNQPDRIHFGHNDGKVTIYDRRDYACLGIISVSVYKISSLAGVGDFLWAGYNTGMIYVYDTTCAPWKVKKVWIAHEKKAIHGIIVDRTSIWKLGRLQVASFGTDNMLKFWDGMLENDWLDDRMQKSDQNFCEFREISAVVMTWNAGASKPTSLRHDTGGAEFFKNLLAVQNSPEVLIFGFQELVDLEDKKVTAKSFFKSKKKDSYDHEHMSHQYRAWRDHLVRCIDEYLPGDTPYTLLHSASLVGLFTCVFVKSSERTRIRDICAAEVKLGMGGLHGNKGALIVRFILDDTSICLINCHLAAGQTQTTHRNKDIAAIMESAALPVQRNEMARSEVFVDGGDGSMILDHEICILNGDLNYRIDAMGADAVKKAVYSNNLGKLLERDQLLLSRRRNPGFRLLPFTESPINFAPTYKYDVGTDTYDTSEKRRSPAWCDRLLYRGKGRIRQLDYKRHEVRTSDHRPVSGRFDIRVKTIIKQKRAAIKKQYEKDFEQVRERIAMDIKLDYLTNVFGLSDKEAKKLLTD